MNRNQRFRYVRWIRGVTGSPDAQTSFEQPNTCFTKSREITTSDEAKVTRKARGEVHREQLRIGFGTRKALELASSGRSSITTVVCANSVDYTISVDVLK